MNAIRVWAAATALALIGSVAGVAGARAAPAAGAHSARSAAHLSMDQAVRMVEKRFKATVVRAESRKRDGRTVYVMRLLDDHGRVFTVRVEASSGRIL